MRPFSDPFPTPFSDRKRHHDSAGEGGVLMESVRRRYSKEEFARRGDAIYEKHVRPELKPADTGKFAAIDIESGQYQLDRDEFRAGNKLRTRLPEAQIWMVRVGHRSVHRIGRELR
jgi:hypothetical protein